MVWGAGEGCEERVGEVGVAGGLQMPRRVLRVVRGGLRAGFDGLARCAAKPEWAALGSLQVVYRAPRERKRAKERKRNIVRKREREREREIE